MRLGCFRQGRVAGMDVSRVPAMKPALPALKDRVFRESFRNKAPLEALLAKIPVRVVREPRLGLIGAAEAAYRMAIETTR